jgi:hypothetical protein
MDKSWMRQAGIDILRYLPEYLAKDADFKATNDADSKEHERIRLAIQDEFDQFFIKTATWGLDYWEKFCGISVDYHNTLGYERRRARVIAQLMGLGTMTPERVTALINLFTTAQGASFTPHYDNYSITVNLPGDGEVFVKDLHEALDKYLPAHIAYLFRYITELVDSTEDFGDVQEQLVARVGYMLEDAYPWPGRTLDGSWQLGGHKLVDGTWLLDGSTELDGVDGTPYALDSDIERLALTSVRFPNITDDFGCAGMELNGRWNLDGGYMLGGDIKPLDAGGELTIKREHRLNGSWMLDGGCRLKLDGTFLLDGSHYFSEGGNYLAVSRECIGL